MAKLIADKANIAILDARRFDEYATMNIPGSVSVPGAELVLRAGQAAPDPDTTIIVNCAGRTRSIIGAQSLINAGVPNKVGRCATARSAGRWRGTRSTHGADRRGAIGPCEGGPAKPATSPIAPASAISARRDGALVAADRPHALSLRRAHAEEYAAGHLPGFRHDPGGQLVQETDMVAPVRGARIVLADDLGVRADMTASWLAQMGWEVYVLEGGFDGALEVGPPLVLPKPEPAHRYRRPYEGTDIAERAMQAYLDWEYGLVDQLRRDGTHGFYVI